MSALDPFDSSRFSIEHAKSHIAEIERLTDAFFEKEPYAVVIEPNADEPTHETHWLKVIDPFPRRVSGLASDVANNLRAALDQACYVIASGAGRTGKQTHFPFGDTLAEAQSRYARGSRDIPRDMFDFMIALKPYLGGNDTLWRLNKRANTNKHRFIVTAPLLTKVVSVGHPLYHGLNLAQPPRWDSANQEMVIARFPRGTEPDLHLQLKAFVQFEDTGLTITEPAVRFLNDCVRMVESIVAALESESRRLGYVT